MLWIAGAIFKKKILSVKKVLKILNAKAVERLLIHILLCFYSLFSFNNCFFLLRVTVDVEPKTKARESWMYWMGHQSITVIYTLFYKHFWIDLLKDKVIICSYLYAWSLCKWFWSLVTSLSAVHLLMFFLKPIRL